jgi:hypothetical protein
MGEYLHSSQHKPHQSFPPPINQVQIHRYPSFTFHAQLPPENTVMGHVICVSHTLQISKDTYRNLKSIILQYTAQTPTKASLPSTRLRDKTIYHSCFTPTTNALKQLPDV